MTLYEIIKAIQAASGSNAKKAILEAHKDNGLLKTYLAYVYDPTVKYWQTKIPKFVKHEGVGATFEMSDRAIFQSLDELASRRVSGSQAKVFLAEMFACVDDDTAELLGYIIGRDIKAGIAEGGILSVWPTLFYVPPYQRCASMSAENKERFAQLPYFYVQTKSDGQFAYAGRDMERTFLMSRAGSLHPQWLADEVCSRVPLGNVAMGELLVYHNGKMLSRKDGNGILNSLLTGDGSKFDKITMNVVFVAWDMVTMGEFNDGHTTRPYHDRSSNLNGTELRIIPNWKVTSVREANRIQTEHTARGEEGTVWKNPEMGWRDCSSGDKDMMKAKTVFEADYRIRGYYEGKGKAKGMLGGLELSTEDDLIQFNVGSGFSDDVRKALWEIRNTLPGKIATVEGNDIVTDKKRPGIEAVFLPIILEVREDKKVANTRDEVWASFNAARMTRDDG